jgi:hypothetical protein
MLGGLLLPAQAVETNRILMIGNSMSSAHYEPDPYFPQLVFARMVADLFNSSTSHYAIVHYNVNAGKGIEWHWTNQDKGYLIYDDYTWDRESDSYVTNRIQGTAPALAADEQGPYDYVFLQPSRLAAEHMEYTADTLHDGRLEFNTYAPMYNTLITNTGGEVVLYMAMCTSGDILDDESTFNLVAETGLDTQASHDEMNMTLINQIGCKGAPHGRAYKRSILEKSDEPGLLYQPDGLHPSVFGRYLMSCTFYAACYGESPEGLTYVPQYYNYEGDDPRLMTTNECRRYQRIAWDTYNYMFTWSNPPTLSVTASVYNVADTLVPITFTAEASDDSSIADYEWNFADGTVTNGVNLTNIVHTFTDPGTYDVWCRVTDVSNETERVGAWITVNETPQAFDGAEPLAGDEIRLTFRETVEETTATNIANYAVSGGLTVLTAVINEHDDEQVDLSLSGDMPYDIATTVTVSNVENLFGQAVPSNSTQTVTWREYETLLFDFGSASTPSAGSWNNVTDPSVGLKVSDAVTADGRTSRIDLSITNDFAGIKTVGYLDDSLYPVSAQRDSFYLDGGHLGGSNDTGSLLISGLDPDALYNFTFFASATNEWFQNAQYVIGAQNTSLDAALHSNLTASINGVQPNGSGEIAIDITAPFDTDYGHLSVLEITTLRHYTLPWSDDFEAASTGTVHGQNGWRVSDAAEGSATVQTAVKQEGSQALELTLATAAVDFDSAATNVWVTFQAQPARSNEGGDVPPDAAAHFYFNTSGQVVAYSNTTAVTVSGFVLPEDSWAEFNLFLDYTAHTWDMQINGTNVLSGFGFYSNKSSCAGIVFTEGTNTSRIDAVSLTDQNPTGNDDDGDGLPNDWEATYFGGSTNGNPSATASNGVNTVMQCYIAGISPIDPDATFLISDLRPQPSESILQWQNASGRVYSVYWTSNLLSGFGAPFASNVTGGAFTDTVHGADSEGFYKIEVELP